MRIHTLVQIHTQPGCVCMSRLSINEQKCRSDFSKIPEEGEKLAEEVVEDEVQKEERKEE